MEQFRISDDERLITLTKQAYDDLNRKIEELERFKESNTVFLRTDRNKMYDRDWYYSIHVDSRFPESIKPYIQEYISDIDSLERSIEMKFKNYDESIRKFESERMAYDRLVRANRLLPSWCMWFFGIKIN